MSHLPEKAVNEFKDLLKTVTGKDYSTEEVRGYAESFFNLLIIVLKQKQKKLYNETAVTKT